MKKVPSPDVNPATHSGCLIIRSLSSIIGLNAGLVSGKALAKSSDNPKLIDALILTIAKRPCR